MLSDRQALYVFEDEIRGPKFGNDSDKIAHESITRIVQRPMPNQ